jgi:hypothetical protein
MSCASESRGYVERIIRILKRIDKAISIDPDVFVKSDWPYLWKK